MGCNDLDLLWQEYFRDPSQFWDNRNSKRGPRSPDFRHKQTKQVLWLNGLHNPPWVQVEFSRRIPMKDGEFGSVWKANQDSTTLLDFIKACGRQKDLCRGSMIHAHARKTGLLRKDICIGPTLVRMYAKCGALDKAQEVFDELTTRDVVTWNALIAGYVEQGHSEEALDCYAHMRDNGFFPDKGTFKCVLKACSSIRAADKGKEIHAEICRLGLLTNHDVMLGTVLVDMYVKCGELAKAQEVFDEIPKRDVVAWTALIAGYAQHGLGEEALECFQHMRDEGFSPNAITFVCILKACGSAGATEKGEEIHAEVRRLGLLEDHNVVLGTALVDMYAKCGALVKAQEVFDELQSRNVVAWTALIAGYAQQGLGEEALKWFQRMRDEGFFPDIVTFVCILKACGSIGATEKGEEIHAEVHELGLLETHSIVLRTALVDMYGKCGALGKAQEVFDELPTRDVVSWTALMAAYAGLGKAKKVLSLFKEMIGEHIKPNSVTFIVLFNACSHAGLVEEGRMYYDNMSSVYGISPTLEHHTCMVDLFSRAGHFDEAITVIEKEPVPELWLALLGACQKWVNVELGRLAFEHVIQLDENCAAAYICLSDIYAAAGMQQDAEKVEALGM